MMPRATKRTGNLILDILPEEERSRLLSAAQVVALPHGREMFRQNGPMTHVYFPTTGVFGVVVLMLEGNSVEVTTVGRDGMLGLPAFLGLDFHAFAVTTQVPGEAVQVTTRLFLQATNPGSAFERIMKRYALYRLHCANQTAACNCLHSVEERTVRWLLMAHDRVARDQFLVTHEFLSELLGVRRQTVSVIAGTLQRAGLVAYRRGLMRVLDRQGLEAASCECYGAMKQLYDRIVRD